MDQAATEAAAEVRTNRPLYTGISRLFLNVYFCLARQAEAELRAMHAPMKKFYNKHAEVSDSQFLRTTSLTVRAVTAEEKIRSIPTFLARHG